MILINPVDFPTLKQTLVAEHPDIRVSFTLKRVRAVHHHHRRRLLRPPVLPA